MDPRIFFLLGPWTSVFETGDLGRLEEGCRWTCRLCREQQWNAEPSLLIERLLLGPIHQHLLDLPCQEALEVHPTLRWGGSAPGQAGITAVREL